MILDGLNKLEFQRCNGESAYFNICSNDTDSCCMLLRQVGSNFLEKPWVLQRGYTEVYADGDTQRVRLELRTVDVIDIDAVEQRLCFRIFCDQSATRLGATVGL